MSSQAPTLSVHLRLVLLRLLKGEELRRPLAHYVYRGRSRLEKLMLDPTLGFNDHIFASLTISLKKKQKEEYIYV